MKVINSFKGENRFLSNFYPCRIMLKKKVWPTTEHLYQACKTLRKTKDFDEVDWDEMRLVPTPGAAKRLGRRLLLHSNWDQVKFKLMLKCLHLKFGQNQDLANKLLGTGEVVLIEGNWWHDNIWGDCLCKNCKDIPGENLLGKALMKVRSELSDLSWLNRGIEE